MLTGQKKLKFFESFFLTAEQLFEIMSEVDQSQLRCFNYGVFLSRVLISIEIYLYPAGINLLKVNNTNNM